VDTLVHMNAKRDLIDNHIRLINESHPLLLHVSGVSHTAGDVLKKLNAQVPEVNRILGDLAPDLGQLGDYDVLPVKVPHVLIRAAELLEQLESMPPERHIEGILAFPLTFYHPLVAGSARPLFEAFQYRMAVNEAATQVNEALQKRIGRYDISDSDLMGKAFSADPPVKGQARLRCPGDPMHMSVRSQQEGAASFAVGCFRAIRNPAHHMTGEWNRIMAFEYLAALSIVARWITGWNLQPYVPPRSTRTAKK
jgi:hypothetical protein